ncbi:membrane cofactor protein-like isoform X1 [Osmerus mordax]|uniref:membrane cofactor protein-like isoform X1 n=1 Tax=Osmerus mordax TaxID=8014 RepID=UPI00350EF983
MQSIDSRRCWLLASGLCLAYMVGTVQAQACSKPKLEPEHPNTVLSPGDIGKETFEDGSNVTIQCHIGYAREGGSPTITCTNGQWSTLKMTCKIKNCGNPGIIRNGQFNIDMGTEFGDTAVATCNVGYKLIGSDRRQCMDGGWNGRIPTCEVSKCGPAPQVVNGKPSSNEESYDYDAVIRYSCNPGFTLKGSKNIFCKGDEVFEPAPPQCIKVECPAPDVPNAIVIDGASAPYGYKSFLTYRCKAGFMLHGADSITCEIESEWNLPIPECRALPTTTKASPTPTTKKPTEKVPVPGPKPTGGTGGTDGTDDHHNTHYNTGAIVGGVIGTLAVCLVAVGVAVHLHKKKKRSRGGYSGNVATK